MRPWADGMGRVVRAWAACTVLGTGCTGDKAEPEPLLRTVRYVVAESEDGARRRTFSGRVQASDQARLSFQVSGRVRSVHVKMGDRVREGQLIATLDPTDFRIQLQEARASLSQARAQARNAESSYRRVRALYENKNASVQDLDTARAQKDSALSVVSAASQSVRRLQRQLEYATLTARSNGIIRAIDVEKNEVVPAGQPVALLQAGEQLEVSLSIPETYVNRIKRGMEVTCVINTLSVQIPGHVTEIGVPGVTSAAFPVRVELRDTEARAEAGMAADVVFSFSPDPRRRGVFRVPTSAVGEDRQGRFVYIVEQHEAVDTHQQGLVRRRAVQTGEIETDGIDIVGGLEGGEKVVTAGVSRIYDGLRVRVPERPPEFLP